MSLRIRLIASIIFVLLLSFGLGCTLAGWSAKRSIRIEMLAALRVGEQTVRHALDDLPRSADKSDDLRHLVTAFNGDRHLRATLLDASGRTIVASAAARPSQAMPGWIGRLVDPALPPRQLSIDPTVNNGSIELQADPANEMEETWIQLRNNLLVLSLFCGLSTLLVGIVVGRALAPLRQMSAALAAIGDGDYAPRLPQTGTADIAGLVRGFNAMAERLSAAQEQNRRLHEHLTVLQEEERAELARDLHDEIGPFLFAVALDAAEIEHAAAGRHPIVKERATSIRESVGHMQHHVRAMLKRLRLSSPVEVGLAIALDNLVTFWREHRPAIAFALTIEAAENDLDEASKAVIFRVAQEGLSNAVRHGQPGQVDLHVALVDRDSVVLVVRDDGVGLTGSERPGLGLTGMRERVATLGGTLHTMRGAGGVGLTIRARLPRDSTSGDVRRAMAVA